MADVLETTAGYADSELSDYESAGYEDENERVGDYKYPSSLKSYYLANNSSNHAYNLKKNFKQERERGFGDSYAHKWSGQVGKAVPKSPRFGREDLATYASNTATVTPDNAAKECLFHGTSFDTVDSLTPANNYESENKTFKWWCDEEIGDTDNSNKSREEDLTDEEVASYEPTSLSSLKESAATGLSIGVSTVSSEKEKEEPTFDKEEAEEVAWKSWTTGTNELEELRNKVLNRLNIKKLNKQNSTDNDKEGGDDKTEGSDWNELQYYKEMNKLLVDRVLFLLNTNGKLEYNLNYQYVTSVQNHLMKVHNYLASVSNTGFVNTVNNTVEDVVADTTNNNDSTSTEEKWEKEPDPIREQWQNSIDVAVNTQEEYDSELVESLKEENARLREEVNELRNRLEADNKEELLEKLRTVEQNKNVLEEDFKKTLTYMRLMKDRLKMFKVGSVHPPTSGFNPGFQAPLAHPVPGPAPRFNPNLSPTVGFRPNNTMPPNYNSVNVPFVNKPGIKPGFSRNNTFTAFNTNTPIKSNTTVSAPNYNVRPSPNPNFNKNVNVPDAAKFNTSPTHAKRPNAVAPATAFPNINPSNSPVTATKTNIPNSASFPNPTHSPILVSGEQKQAKRRSNSCVRFNEESELFVVPRFMSESHPIIRKENKISNFFKLFTK